MTRQFLKSKTSVFGASCLHYCQAFSRLSNRIYYEFLKFSNLIIWYLHTNTQMNFGKKKETNKQKFIITMSFYENSENKNFYLFITKQIGMIQIKTICEFNCNS